MSRSQELQFKEEQNGNIKTIAGRYYQGIIPSPEMLHQYQQIDAALPHRILTFTDDEVVHRRKIESRLINNAFLAMLIGNLFGFLAILASIASVVGIFVIKRYMTSKNSD